MRWIPVCFLILGFPAWFVYWISSPNALIYLYAIMGYAAAMIVAGWYGAGIIGHTRS
jgi:hypothetical protein